MTGPDDEDSASVSVGADETRPDDEESALASIGADDSTSAVEGEGSMNVGWVWFRNGGAAMTRGGSRLFVWLAVAWMLCKVLQSVGEMVANIRRVW